MFHAEGNNLHRYSQMIRPRLVGDHFLLTVSKTKKRRRGKELEFAKGVIDNKKESKVS